MLCNTCIHKKVCKHTDHFKEYEKQYEEMGKKSSLFDNPIECPCYENKREHINMELKEKTDEAKNINSEIKRTLIKCKIFELKNEINENINFLWSILRVYPKNFSEQITSINNKFNELEEYIDKLKIN